MVSGHCGFAMYVCGSTISASDPENLQENATLLITSYRNGIYIPAFLAGYYLFSNESVMEKIKNAVLLLGICAAVSGIFYIVRCYGMAYTDKDVLSRWDLNLYAIFYGFARAWCRSKMA